MKRIARFSALLSIVLVLALLPLANATAQDERILQIDRRVLDPAPTAVTEADIPPPPAALSKTEKLQFLEQVVSQPPPRQAMLGTFTRLQADVVAKTVSLLDNPDIKLTPGTPVAPSKPPGAWLQFDYSLHVYSAHVYTTPYAVFQSSGSGLIVYLEDPAPGQLYLVDFSVHASLGEVFLFRDTNEFCLINFSTAPVEFSITVSESQHLQAIVETKQPATVCRLSLREKDEKHWIFYSWELTKLN